MKIENLTAKDIHHLKALQPDGWSDIIPAFKLYLNQSFCLPIKISLKNKILGVGAAIVFGNTAWLAHIIVAPEFRNTGIGQTLIIHLLNRLKNINCQSISLIATDSGYPVYKKAGFIKQTEYLFFERKTPWKGSRDSEKIIPYTRRHEKEVLLLDKNISGEDRSNLLMDWLSGSYVYFKNKKCLGVYLPDLGEGMIIADDAEAGVAIMKIKHAIKDKAVLPMENAAGIRFLMENGFVKTLGMARMVWGRKFLWRPDKLYSRIGGNFG